MRIGVHQNSSQWTAEVNITRDRYKYKAKLSFHTTKKYVPPTAYRQG
jgi:hypothetical protein